MLTSMWLERFSPYFLDPARHGIQRIRAKPYYATLCRATDVDLDRLAYVFDYDHAMQGDGALHEAHRKLARVLKDVGVVKGSAEGAVASGLTRAFLPHGLGHSLGLQVHDVGCKEKAPKPENPYLRNTSIIEEGQVFTIEPGCYFIASLLDELKASPEGKAVDWKLVDELRPFGGVRIEDDLQVTAAGYENLTREFLPN